MPIKWFPRTYTVLVSLAALLWLVPAADGQILVNARAPYTAPGPTAFQPGNATSPDGHTLGLNQRFLTRDGKPWLPVMGEFHFSRVPAAEWEEEILKMKAGGVDVIAAYIIWLHHEEVKGQFDWSGDRDLRHFAQLCAKHHMALYARIGPWAHGEARHGGLPDWVLAQGPTRVNDPAYMAAVATFYGAIGEQLKGLLWKDGGPVVGVQLENEYANRAPGGGEAHILALKRLALQSGLDVPFYSVTGWDHAVVPAGAVLPVFGGYPDAPWDASLKNLPPNEVYTFRFENRVSGNMGAIDGTSGASPSYADTPFLTAEVGGGIQDTYHRRPVMRADDIAAMFPVMLGSGVNLYGSYMFQGGQNPEGRLTTLQESQATGYPTDVPVKSYDFQAPLGEFGQERESFRKLKVVDYFLQAFGEQLAPMNPHAPAVLPQTPGDLSVPRLAVRSKDDAGFLFVNNYVRGAAMPARAGFQVKVALPGGDLLLPERPLDVPSGSYFIWPFYMDLGGFMLRYSTAQLFTKIMGERPTYVFFCVPGVRCELAFADHAGLVVETSSGKLRRNGKFVTLSNFAADADTVLSLKSARRKTVQILVLTQKDAERAWMVRLGGGDRLLFTAGEFFADEGSITLRSNGDPTFRMRVFPALTASPAASSPLTLRQLPQAFSELSARLPSFDPKVRVTVSGPVGIAPMVKMGPPPTWRPAGVAQAPDDAGFVHAGTWKLMLDKDPLHGLSDLFLDVDYTGDVARFRDGTHLLDDNFYNGMPWTIGMKRFFERHQTGDLTLQILPLRADSPIFAEDGVRSALPRSGQVGELRSVRAIPQYELNLQTQP
ncbi:beta-galactosidase [Granulicella sp. dw_53]|uniref:beta-galactosidase n=1 Tax=Granulicella sp. dw_53 TaxID=2719792 RepID=UPI001BD370AD|nr:beta-galactosidase [Granulicella sp. dw_53]